MLSITRVGENHWALRCPIASAAGSYEQTAESSLTRWHEGNRGLIRELVGAATVAIADMLQEEGAGAGDSGQRVAMPLVVGAPRDGAAGSIVALLDRLKKTENRS